MKKRNAILWAVLVGVISISVGYDYGWARAGRTIMPAKVGVVNVDAIFRDSKKQAQWRSQMDAQETKMLAELKKLDQEAEAIKADMETREPGSPDYMSLMSSYLEKKATADARTKYYEGEFAVKGQKWIETLYGQIRAIIRDISRENGLDIVLATQEVDLRVANVRDFAAMIRTNKVIYHSADLDITAEVLAELDASR